MEAVERARTFKLCPHRIWAISRSLQTMESNLPTLIPTGMVSVISHKGHDRCTFDFCEYSRLDYTSVTQRHECLDGNCDPRSFPPQTLEEHIRAGKFTAWKLDGWSMIDPSQPFMAISHVWADGTGTGTLGAGMVNECLYDLFHKIAEQFQCEGIWWDTICIPGDKGARSTAMNNIQSNYAKARITLVHDCYLREWEWVDAESACFAIVMSPWFSRGWTALELAKSRKVKVLFKSNSDGFVIKDLDEDILAKESSSSSWHRVTTNSIKNLRGTTIKMVGDILTVLGPR
ncbi:hypothetical protein B0O99DRAFT_552118, partial [Bisporella sp. PMI_857]